MSLQPNPLASNEEKDSLSYGRDYARFISNQWMNGPYTISRSQIELLENHMKGTVDASHLKKLFSPAKDISTLGVSWKYSSEVPKFITAITEGFSYDKYRTSVKSIDGGSQEKRSRVKREKKKAMLVKEDAKQLSELFGMDFTHKGYVPESGEELNLWMELEYKMSHEIGLELGIQQVFNINDWKEIFNNIATDLALHGIGVANIDYHPDTAVALRYVNPKNFIYSRDTENTRDMRGSYYFGEVRSMTISEIERFNGVSLSIEEIKNLSGLSSVHTHTSFDEFTPEELEYRVDVIKFCFKTNRYDIKKKKYNQYGGYKYLSKDDYWTPPANMKSEVLRIPYEVWYEGYYIPGADILLDYKLMDNIMRDPSNSRKAISPYIMYRLGTESIGKRIIDISDDIYVVLVKLRQFVIKMRPKGYAIDIDGLGSLTAPDGTVIDTLTQVRILNEDGNLLYSGSNLIDGSMQARPPIYNLPDAQGRELSELTALYSVLVQRLHDITGINPQAVGAAPPPRTTSAVYAGTLSSAQRVVNNIFNGLLSIQKRCGEAIISRIQSAALFSETKSIIESLLGEYTSDVIRDFAQLHKYQFVLNVDISPTDEDRMRLSQDLNIALNSGLITVSDKIDIEEIDNLRLARQMIKIRQRKTQQEAQRIRAQEAQYKQQLEAIKGEEKRKAMEFENALKTQLIMAEKELEARMISFKENADMNKISLKGQWDIAIERERRGTKINIDKFKEDRKDNRTKIQATQQSQLIEQRKKDTSPKVFTEQQPDLITP